MKLNVAEVVDREELSQELHKVEKIPWKGRWSSLPCTELRVSPQNSRALTSQPTSHLCSPGHSPPGHAVCSGPGRTAARVPFLLLFLFLDSRYLTPLVCIGLMALTPVWVLIARKNPPIVKILKFGWFPIILAMVISR